MNGPKMNSEALSWCQCAIVGLEHDRHTLDEGREDLREHMEDCKWESWSTPVSEIRQDLKDMKKESTQLGNYIDRLYNCEKTGILTEAFRSKIQILLDEIEQDQINFLERSRGCDDGDEEDSDWHGQSDPECTCGDRDYCEIHWE